MRHIPSFALRPLTSYFSKEEGAMLWLADDLPGFASLYPSDDADSEGGKAKLQLFWAINYNL